MNKKVTLGGDRLGAGKKMQVNLHGFERSTHDLGYIWRSTMAPGTLVPFMKNVALPGDTFDINLNADVKTLPTISALFGSFKLQLDIFQIPMRLYNREITINKYGIGLDMSKIKFPLIKLKTNKLNYNLHTAETNNVPIEIQQIEQSSLLAYLGIRGNGVGETTDNDVTRYYNALPLLMYWDIYKNYYANKQEEKGAVLSNIKSTQSDENVLTYGDHYVAGVLQQPKDDLNFSFNSEQTLQIYLNETYEPWGDLYISIGSPQSDIPFKYIDFSSLFSRYQAGDITNFKCYNMSWDTLASELGTDLTDFDIEYEIGNMTTEIPSTDITKELVIELFNIENIDELKENLLKSDGVYIIDSTNEDLLSPYKDCINYNTQLSENLAINKLQGLAVKTYQSDIFNNWLNSEWIDGENGINAITAIDTSSGSFTIDTFNLATKVKKQLDRIAVEGGTYEGWLSAVYSHEPFKRANSPVYCGGLSKEIIFQEVLSNSETEGKPLATIAGKGTLAQKHKGGYIRIKVDEPSYIIGIISITPRIDYSQGNDWDMDLRTYDDLHKPALDQIGFQDLITKQMAFWESHGTENNETLFSAGKQPAWLWYMTAHNKTYGNFANSNDQMFMTLNRMYEINEDLRIKDLTTYIDPQKFNYIFADTRRDAQNFWVQIAVDIEARRKMSAKLMPNI